MQKKERISVYIDGFNLYFGIRDRFPKAKWLDVKALSKNLLKQNQTLIDVKYFTARIRNNPPKEKRQNTYLDALNTTDIQIIYGQYYSKKASCTSCGHSWNKNEEKMTDVNIAVHLITDALENKYDKAIIISGDSDLVPPIKALHKFFKDKKIIVAFPPKRHSYSLKNEADNTFIIGRKKLMDSQLPEEIKLSSGYVICKPPKWP